MLSQDLPVDVNRNALNKCSLHTHSNVACKTVLDYFLLINQNCHKTNIVLLVILQGAKKEQNKSFQHEKGEKLLLICSNFAPGSSPVMLEASIIVSNMLIRQSSFCVSQSKPQNRAKIRVSVIFFRLKHLSKVCSYYCSPIAPRIISRMSV